jgi:hypothetical protein
MHKVVSAVAIQTADHKELKVHQAQQDTDSSDSQRDLELEALDALAKIGEPAYTRGINRNGDSVFFDISHLFTPADRIAHQQMGRSSS